MALKFNIPFPVFAPPVPTQNPHCTPNPSNNRGPSEIRFARWNNANAEPFNQQRRAQEEIEADIRRLRRYDAVDRITQTRDSGESSAVETFKSIGTPSSPSASSIPGRKSKYSKTEPDGHPAFRSLYKKKKPQVPKIEPQLDAKANVKISEDGVSYVIDGAPFEFKYSYTETPKVKPLKLRETPYVPFGPTTMGRPWTGRPPLPPSKKKLREFDSFKLPPANKKGVKPVQKPGPFVTGTGPKYVYKREDILGEPLTKEEIAELIGGCAKAKRQLNMGRDGLTHNMLDNIHSLWKRRRACKIKCKGVCTVDMENVCQQLEDKTGGKVIYRKGGVLYLFRGRNYNYKTRPRFPLMLWKPVTPVYPRLIHQVPEGLTLEEATEMRKKGRELIPIRKLAKNGVYNDLVKHIREAFEVCELVRIDCQGVKASDYRRVGAKLKDLVPCVLISFEFEHILIYRGHDWKSSLPIDKSDKTLEESKIDVLKDTDQEQSENFILKDTDQEQSENPILKDTDQEQSENLTPLAATDEVGLLVAVANDKPLENAEETISDNVEQTLETQIDIEKSQDSDEAKKSCCTEKVLHLLNEAIEKGIATLLDDATLDADGVYERAVVFAGSAPPGPVFHNPYRKKVEDEKKVKKEEKEEPVEAKESVGVGIVVEKKRGERKVVKTKRNVDLDVEGYMSVVPQGTLKVDELAKLLA